MFLGRVVRPGIDPEWLPTDSGLALAWQQNRAETCTGCGTRPDEWAFDEHAYISDHYTCPGCQRLQEHAAGNVDRGPDDRPVPGQHTFLVPRGQYELKRTPRTAGQPLHLTEPEAGGRRA